MIMETDQSQDLQSADWRSRRADGLIPIQKLQAQVPGQASVSREGQPFLIQAFNWLDEAHHVAEDNLLYSVFQFRCYPHPETPS